MSALWLKEMPLLYVTTAALLPRHHLTWGSPCVTALTPYLSFKL